MLSDGLKWETIIPRDWNTVSVNRIFTLGRGRVISHEDIFETEGEYPAYPSQTENNGILGSLNTYDFEGDYITWTTDGANAGTVFTRTGKFNCTNVCGTLKQSSNKKKSVYKICKLLSISRFRGIHTLENISEIRFNLPKFCTHQVSFPSRL